MRRAIGALLLGLLVTACGGGGASGPAWPKSAGKVEVTEPDQDGGESLEPQQAASVAAVEHADDRTPAIEAIVIEAPAPTPEVTPAPATPTDVTPPVGEVQIEVIEIKPEDLILEP